MKKKIMLVLCTILILCAGTLVNAATSLKDVKNTKYEDSVNTLITLGLVNGYPEDNTYRPNNAVTRAEMAKLMVVALGEEDNVEAAKKASPKFKDVKSTSWEYGYVNLASQLGIINGYPDGTFGPQNTVSYAEATTMIIRALEYEDEVNKSNEVWPTNYINQAKKLSLYDSVGNVNSAEGAKRGNIAILLWNMLRTGMCTAVSQSGNNIIYGEGELMINKKMDKFAYLEDAIVNKVSFDDSYEVADVKFVGDKSLNVTMDALEAAEIYGQRFNILYNKSTKKIESLEEADDTNIKEGEITKLTSSKIYIKGGNSNGYKLPDDDNILLYGIDDIEDAVTATLVLEGSTLKYVVGYAPEKIYLALVTDTEVTVDDKDGIRVVNYKGTSAKSYALYDEEDMPNKDDVILYYLNSDDELVIWDTANVYDSKEISAASSSKIQTGKTTYKLSDMVYEIVKVGASSLSSMSVTNIEEDEDSLEVMAFAGTRYFIIYIGGVEEAIEKLEEDIEVASKNLSNYIKKAAVKNAYNGEAKYTIATYAKFASLYDEANAAIEAAKTKITVANLNKLNSVYTDIQSAYSGLKLLTSLSAADKAEETEMINAKIALRKIVNGTTLVNNVKVTDCVSNKSIYTASSYKTFETALNNANAVLKNESVTLNKIENAKDNLVDAVKALLKIEDSDKITAAKSLLDDALAKAAKVGNKSDYTEASYNNFLSRWNEAKAIKSSTTVSEADIKEATQNLNDAMDLLTKNIDKIWDELNELLLDAQKELEKEDVYTTESFNALDSAYENGMAKKSDSNASYSAIEDAVKKLNSAIEGLVKVDEKLAELKTKAATYGLQAIKDIVTDMPEDTLTNKELKIKKLEKAMKDEDELISFYSERLARKISEASEIQEANWSTDIYNGTFADMKIALDAATQIKNKKNATSDELKVACTNLEAALELK